MVNGVNSSKRQSNPHCVCTCSEHDSPWRKGQDKGETDKSITGSGDFDISLWATVEPGRRKSERFLTICTVLSTHLTSHVNTPSGSHSTFSKCTRTLHQGGPRFGPEMNLKYWKGLKSCKGCSLAATSLHETLILETYLEIPQIFGNQWHVSKYTAGPRRNHHGN